MSEKPSYEELEQRVWALETEKQKNTRIEQGSVKRQEYLESVFHNAPSAIITLDPSHCVIDWNPGAQKIFGYSSDEARGRDLDDLVSRPEVRQQALDNTHKVLSGELLEPMEAMRYRKDGSLVHVIASGAPIIIDHVLKGAVALYTDISPRKRAEQRFFDLFNSISDLICTLDMEGRFISVNPSMCTAFDHREDELIGRPASDFMKTEFVTAFKKEYLEPIKKYGHHEGTTIYFKKNGEKIYIEYTSVLVQPEDGELFISVSGRDITEKILSERKLARLQEEIIQSRKMESIGILTGGIAHDFNNILHMIFGNVELALEDIPQNNPAYNHLEEIKFASIRAAGIVKQLLNFTRKTEQKLQPMGAVEVIQNALRFLRTTIPATIEIREQMTEDNMAILADPIQINRLMMNLFSNATHAMEKAGGILEVRVDSETIDRMRVKNFPDLAPGKYAKITLIDVGHGIDPDIINRIFDPYFTTKQMGEGSGMGLAIVHGIVKNHNGAIWVDSRLGKGTTINLLFPVVNETRNKENQVKSQIPCGTETILFVDDETSITTMAKIMLKRLGYSVVSTLNPKEALELFRSGPDQFDLVITDMTMPQMTGAQLSEKLMEIRRDIPIIISTGHSSLIDEEKAKKLGIAGYVMKPMSMARLARSIRMVLDK